MQNFKVSIRLILYCWLKLKLIVELIKVLIKLLVILTHLHLIIVVKVSFRNLRIVMVLIIDFQIVASFKKECLRYY